MSTFAEQVAAALDTERAQEAAERVQRVVMAEIAALDPAIEPRPTGYFNHSYIPDVVMEWSDQGKQGQRSLFLRHSLRSSEATGDWEALTTVTDTPMYLSLAPREPAPITRRARRRTTPESRALVTTVPALDELTEQPDRERDPLLNVVRANLVRSARGLVVGDDVDDLVLPSDRRVEPQDLEAFNASVLRTFTEDGAVRINRVFNIVRAALAPEEQTLAFELDWGGVLSDTEVRNLLPYLLTLDGVAENRAFWRRLGAAMTLRQIERLYVPFSDVDLTPLVAACADLWQATRAQLAIRSEVIDDELADRPPTWRMSGRTLTAEVGDWRVHFAWDGKKLRGRKDSLPARWEDLRPELRPYDVTQVELHGVSRRVTSGSDGSADVKGDVDRIIATIEDSFHIPSVTVQVTEDDEPKRLAADFVTMLVHAEPPASLSAVIQVALKILGYRYPVGDADLAALLGESTDGGQ